MADEEKRDAATEKKENALMQKALEKLSRSKKLDDKNQEVLDRVLTKIKSQKADDKSGDKPNWQIHHSILIIASKRYFNDLSDDDRKALKKGLTDDTYKAIERQPRSKRNERSQSSASSSTGMLEDLAMESMILAFTGSVGDSYTVSTDLMGAPPGVSAPAKTPAKDSTANTPTPGGGKKISLV